MPAESYPYDVFISHTSADKERFVRPLAEALQARGLVVWYDDWELEVGDWLVQRINDGLRLSRFGVVVLSPGFFEKNWPKAELDALAALEARQGRAVLLPVWLDVGADEIASIAPLLLTRVALRAGDGVEAVAEKLTLKVRGRDGAASPAVRTEPRRLYPRELASYSLPHSYSPPLAHDDVGFVFRTVVALSMPIGQDQHLTSQQKRSLQAIVSDSAIETLLQELVDRPGSHPAPTWSQVQPSTGTVATIARGSETMGGREGSIEARSGLLLRSYAIPLPLVMDAD